MHHERYRSDDDQHHYRDGIQQYAYIDMQLFGKVEPGNIKCQQALVSTTNLFEYEKVFVGCKD